MTTVPDTTTVTCAFALAVTFTHTTTNTKRHNREYIFINVLRRAFDNSGGQNNYEL